jgi:hypothetical protein
VVPDGFTVKIRGRHLTSGPVKCEGKPGLIIDGMSGVISAKELRDVYTVYDVAETDPRVAMTGFCRAWIVLVLKYLALRFRGR